MNSKLQSNQSDSQKRQFCVHDLMKSFIAELLRVNPDIDSDELRISVSQKFQLAPEHVLIFGRWPDLHVLTHPQVAGELERRFGKVTDEKDVDEKTFNDVRHSQFWNNV